MANTRLRRCIHWTGVPVPRSTWMCESGQLMGTGGWSAPKRLHRCDTMRLRCLSLAAKDVGAVQEQHVQVGVKVRGRAEALNQGDRAGPGAGRDGQAGVLHHECRDTALNYRKHLGQRFRLRGQQETRWKRKGQHELPHCHLGKHVIDQMRGRFHHAARATAWAEPPALADERHQVLMRGTGATRGMRLPPRTTPGPSAPPPWHGNMRPRRRGPGTPAER